jgi:iron(III) transport system substrate-binding protein
MRVFSIRLHRLIPLLALPLALVCGCADSSREVVVYCALDSVFSDPVLKQFEKQSGIRVRAKYDTEAAKTTGLAQALVNEKQQPRCDVFWNNEIIHTLRLAEEGVLDSYLSPSAADWPEQWIDPSHRWTAIAARARVLVYNPEKLSEDALPEHVDALTAEAWKSRVVIAKPLFGTTATHMAVLREHWGQKRFHTFLEHLKANKVQLADGNASVVRLVAAGEYDVGLTDTDDVFMALKDKQPIAWRLIGQDAEHAGSLLIPNTVAMIKQAPHPEEARELIDYLLSAEVEKKLAASDSHQLPLRPGLPPPENVPAFYAFKTDFAAAAKRLDEVFQQVKDQLL